MTIEYKDSKRITALSTDVVETLDYSDDFSSDGYTDVGSNVGVSNGKMKFTNTAGGDNRSHKSLGITLDSNFISRFEYKRLSTTSGNIPTYPVVFTATNSDPEADNDFIAIRVDSGGTAYLTVDDGTTNTVTSGITISNDVNYFIELKREGTTSYLSIKTGSHTGSDISGSPVNLSTPTSVTGLTTVQHAVKSNQTGGSYNAEIDNLEIYNGETSLTSKPTNVQDNSLLVEKDTARRYWFSITPVNGYDVANISSDSKSSNGSSQSTLMLGLGFNADGTKAYRVGYSVRSIFQYSLSTAWDISTASYDSVSFSLPSPIAVPYGIEWNGDGTKFVVCDSSTGDLYQFSLSTAYDISTTNSTPTTYDPSETTSPDAIKFNSDGTKAFVIGQGNDTVYRYSLSTAYDISTMSYDSNSFTYPSGYYGTGLEFNSDGTEMYLQDHVGNSLRRYTLSTAYDLSTASLTSSFSTSSQFSSQTTSSLTFSTDGTKLYIGGYGASDQQYSTGTAEARTWNEDMTGVTSALTVDNFTVGTSTQSSSTGTESHTVSASSKEKKILLVTVRTGGVDSTISSCTYAGVAMTSLGTDTTGAGNYTRHTCFYLLNPPTGTADIVATKSNSSAHCKIVALSLYGAKQTAPTFAVNAGSYSPSSGITTNITPPANSWVYSTLSGSSPTNSTNDPPSTYYTNDELTVLNSDTSVTKKKYGLKKDPTTGSVNAVQMYFKHPANNNNQPVVLSVFAVEPLG